MHLKVRYRQPDAEGAQAFGTLLAGHGLAFITIEQLLADEITEYGAIANGYDEERGERLAAALSTNAKVIGFEIRPQQA